MREHLGHLVVLDETLHHLASPRGRDDDVEIAHCLLRAAITARDHRLTHARGVCKMAYQCIRVLARHRKLDALSLRGRCAAGSEDLLLGFRAETAEFLYLPRLAARRRSSRQVMWR